MEEGGREGRSPLLELDCSGERCGGASCVRHRFDINTFQGGTNAVKLRHKPYGDIYILLEKTRLSLFVESLPTRSTPLRVFVPTCLASVRVTSRQPTCWRHTWPPESRRRHESSAKGTPAWWVEI